VIDALIAGRIHGAPAERIAKNGKSFATAKVRVSTREGEAYFVNVIAFAEPAVAALLRLADGDSVALSGELTPRVYVPPQGEPRPSLDLLAHAVISPYNVARKRKTIRDADSQDVLRLDD
jgi:single-stranded DNA-binding protein